MVPRITSKGKSFKGAGAYFLHDLGKAQTSERVAFTYTVNMLTDDAEKALKVMAWTAAHAQALKQVSGQKMTGRKAENPVFNYVLSWAPDQNPDQAHMTEFGLKSLEALGVAEHEAVFVAHNDTDHLHLHVIVNRVHPVTGIMAKMSKDQLALSRLAQAYEQETGQIYCHDRIRNNDARSAGKNVKAEKGVRKTNTPEYQQRRADRVNAQRQAAALELSKLNVQAARDKAVSSLLGSFEKVAGQGGAHVVQNADPGPSGAVGARGSRAASPAAARQAKREAARRVFLDQKRASNWADYEARQWQALNDKQTYGREGLYDMQVGARAKLEERLARKYGPAEALIARHLEDAQARHDVAGVRGALDKLTGARVQLKAKVDTLKAARASLDAQKEAERKVLADRQAVQRATQGERQAAERQRLGSRLQETKAKQDAAFETREQLRTAQRSQVQAEPTVKRARAADAAAVEAQRRAIRKNIQALKARRTGLADPAPSALSPLDALMRSEKYQKSRARAQQDQAPSKPLHKDHEPDR